MKVAHYIPAYRRQIDPGVWFQGVREGVAASEHGYTVIPCWESTNGIDRARNRIVEGLRQAGIEYLFMQDSDNYSKEAIIPRLLETAEEKGAAVVAAAIPLRRDDTPTINVYPFHEGEVYEAEMAGTGMMLVDLRAVSRVAEKYSGPWFVRSFVDERGGQLGEGGDIHFCRVMREHGESVWVDATIQTDHVLHRTMEFLPDRPGKRREQGEPAAVNVG